MSPTETTELPRLDQDGEACDGCGAPLAFDQRYCLNCGQSRRVDRVDFDRHVNGLNGVVAQPAADASSTKDVTPLGAVVGVAILGVMLLVGVLIGRGDGGDQRAPQIVTAAAPTEGAAVAGGSSEAVSNTGEARSEWPKGKDGWTVELGTLPKDGTDAAAVDAAKADVELKGATDVGALDSDLYGTLPSGNYVIYSGVFDTVDAAEKALKELEAAFPDAQVIEVAEKASDGSGGGGGKALTSGENAGDTGIVEASEEDISALDQATGDDYQEILKKLPDQIETPGKPPPVDNSRPAGAGTDAEVIP